MPVPYQENGCDCGVFVCRYAYSLFVMNKSKCKFTWEDYAERFLNMITRGPAFQFDMTDIARIREEMGTLIDRLSTPYLKMKEEEKAEQRAQRKKAKSAKQHAKKSADEEITSENNNKNSAGTAAEPSEKDSGAKDVGITEATAGLGTEGDAILPSSEEEKHIPLSQDDNFGGFTVPDVAVSSLHEIDRTTMALACNEDGVTLSGNTVGAAADEAENSTANLLLSEEKENISQSHDIPSAMQKKDRPDLVITSEIV